jgi:hypothetical protein
MNVEWTAIAELLVPRVKQGLRFLVATIHRSDSVVQHVNQTFESLNTARLRNSDSLTSLGQQ